jgi:hemolysin activation/secretion protein
MKPANLPHNLKPVLITLLLSISTTLAHAADPVIPNAGSILQQIQPITPPAPSSSETGLTIERTVGGKLPPSAPFPVKSIRIKGNTLFDTPVLQALVASAEGQSLTLAQLDELAGHITDYYHDHGYPLARALIPEQVIQDGIVVIEIIEARYGKIRLDNRSRVNDPLLQESLAGLQSNAPIDQNTLGHSLLLITDFPGVVVNATLKPGDTVGTSDLVVEAGAGSFVTGNAALDDFGNRYTGRLRLSGTMNLNNPLHHGDVLSASAMTSGSGMDYGRISYEVMLNGKGTRLGGSYSDLRYKLNGSLASLDVSGKAQVENLWLKHPFVRNENVNLTGQIQYDQKLLRDHINASALDTDRHLDNWTASVSGDARDGLLAGAVNSWNFSFTAGNLGFDNTAAQVADAATGQTQGGFSKANLSLVRLQGLSAKNSLYLSFSDQWASKNLDSSEKMVAGGPFTVRAYDIGAISGDTGYQATIEFRRTLGMFLNGQWQAIAFVDSAHLTVNKNVWVAGDNSATLSGAGLGLNWVGSNRWAFKTYISTPTGPTPALAATSRSTHAWNELSMNF